MKIIPLPPPKNSNIALSTQLCCLLHQSSLLCSSFQRSAMTAFLGVKLEIAVLMLAYRSPSAS